MVAERSDEFGERESIRFSARNNNNKKVKEPRLPRTGQPAANVEGTGKRRFRPKADAHENEDDERALSSL